MQEGVREGLGCDWQWKIEALLVFCPFGFSIGFSKALTHLYLLHRVYQTPVQLHKWGRGSTTICSKFERDHGDLVHGLWRCLKLNRYWNEIIDTISQVYIFKLPRDPPCLFVGRPGGGLYHSTCTYRGLTFIIYAWKLIACYCIAPRVPTRRQWVEQVNNMFIRKKLTYQRRNVPLKFYFMLQPWLDVPNLASPVGDGQNSSRIGSEINIEWVWITPYLL